jgi:hypothetical protein
MKIDNRSCEKSYARDLTRREFLGSCAACSAGITSLGGTASVRRHADTISHCDPDEKAKIRLVFSHIEPEKPTWPNIGYDYEGRKKELIKRLRQGCPNIEFEALNDAYRKADSAKARSWADRWIRDAEKVVEPTRQEIEKSGAMYLGMCDLMERHKARAITINCLGGFYGGSITAYP